MTNSIAIDGRTLTRKQRGMPTYVFMLCKLIPRAMCDVKFYVLVNKSFEHNEPQNNYTERLKQIARSPNVDIVDVPCDSDMKWELFLLPKVLKRLQVNAIHMPTNRVALLTGVPQIVTFHDAMEYNFLSEIYHTRNTTSLKDKLYVYRHKLYAWLTYKYGTKKATELVTISNFSQNSLSSSLGEHFEKAVTIYHGIPTDFVANSEIAALEHRQGVLMLGGDNYQKNPENAIKAWAELPDSIKKKHPLKIIGFSGNEHSPILTTISKLGIDEQVEIQRWVSQEELVRAFQNSAALLFVSREEGFGFPLVQAMTCGTPSVISEAEALLELSKGASLSAPAEAPSLITEQLNSLLSNQLLWQALRAKGLQRSQDFTWQAFTSKTSEIYQKVLTKSNKQ